ncbi:MAG TPA: Holliday junction resolvase RuvX [Candidatus Pacebacteria bacterium]|nr:Holliday junction resolvase RuvX [Candidatus Paceibacterota bacterium]HCR11057.1 Holliday junction resolvase RuvX [Candidatus Paceibacterota bacterium]
MYTAGNGTAARYRVCPTGRHTMKLLAIDYGTKRVGVALNHEWLAEPFAVYERSTALDEVVKLVRSECIEAVVIGISEGKMAEDARRFTHEVCAKTGAKYIEVDETLTSRETHEKLASSAMSKQKRQKPIDHYAAAAILQDYLDTHQS